MSFTSCWLSGCPFSGCKGDSSKRSKEYVQTVMEYCLSQVVQPISIQNLAARIGLDRFYLSRLFKKEVGIHSRNTSGKPRKMKRCGCWTRLTCPSRSLPAQSVLKIPCTFPGLSQRKPAVRLPNTGKKCAGKKSSQKQPESGQILLLSSLGRLKAKRKARIHPWQEAGRHCSNQKFACRRKHGG